MRTDVLVVASNVRPTTTDVKGAMDVDFRAIANGVHYQGTTTLVDGRAWGGDIGNWLDRNTVDALGDLDFDDFRAVVEAIETACGDAVVAHRRKRES
jgi:hypothetical protein